MTTFTPQQEAFFEALLTTKDNLLLEAVAGSGKTTTLLTGLQRLHAAGRLPAGTLVCAFNKHIEREFAAKLEKANLSSVTVRTLNALGHRAWARTVGRNLVLDGRKPWKIAKEIFPAGPDSPLNAADFIPLVNYMRTKDYKPHPSQFGQPDLTAWRQLAEEFDFDPGEFSAEYLFECAENLLARMNQAALTGFIDFTDQLYMPVVYQSTFQSYDLVLVDEVQDLGVLQHEMLRRMRGPFGRLVCAGDRHQAIYGFRGADTHSIAHMTETFSLRQLPLTVSFRCPSAVVEVAQEIVPHISAAPSAPAGRVDVSTTDDIREGDFVLCRYNAPLIKCWLKLIKRGLGAVILGKDIGTKLAKLLRKHSSSQDLRTALVEFTRWAEAEAAVLRRTEKITKLERLLDQLEAIETLCEAAPPAATVDWFDTRIAAMFSDEAALITLSTIHKAKGLEFLRVHFIGREKLPPKRATGDDLEQEMNLIYVGITRAKQELYFLSMSALAREGRTHADELLAPQELRSAPASAPPESPRSTPEQRAEELRLQEEFLAKRRQSLDDILESL